MFVLLRSRSRMLGNFGESRIDSLEAFPVSISVFIGIFKSLSIDFIQASPSFLLSALNKVLGFILLENLLYNAKESEYVICNSLA